MYRPRTKKQKKYNRKPSFYKDGIMSNYGHVYYSPMLFKVKTRKRIKMAKYHKNLENYLIS